MTTFRRFTYTNPSVTIIISDENTNFEWIAFDKNSNGICNLRKVSSFDLNQIYFSIDKSVDKIIAGDIDSSKLYLVYDDSSLIAEIISLTNPLTSTTEISIPIGIDQIPVDIKVDGSDLFILLPGSDSGTNSKILQYNTSGTLQQTINLTKSGSTVTNATSFVIDDNSDIWVSTNNNPAEYVRVFDTGGDVYDFTINEVT